MSKDEPEETSARSEPSAPALAAVLAASAVCGWLVFSYLVLRDDTPLWDELAHALHGALIAHDLRELDWTALLLDTYTQVYWPPLHSWALAGVFLVAGESLAVARVVSVLAYVLLAPTLFLTGRTVAPRHGVLAGSIAAALALTSPGLIISAAQSMLELPGLLALSASTLVYCWLGSHPEASPRAHTLLGLGAVLTFLVKSNYGVLLVIVIVLAKLIEVDFRIRRLATKQNLYAALPLAVFSVVWFAYPPKVMWTWNMLVNSSWGGEEARGFSGLLYFPRAIVNFSGSHWMAVVLWAGLIFAWQARRRPGIAFLAMLPLVLLLIGTFHHTKIPRHILPIFPPLFVLVGMGVAEVWAFLRSGGSYRQVAAIGVLTGVTVLHAGSLARRDWLPPGPPVAEVLDHVSLLVRENGPVLVLGTRGIRPQPPYIDWHLTGVEELLPVTAADAVMESEGMRQIVGSIREAPVPDRLRVSAQRVWGRYYEPSAARSLHVGSQSVATQAQFEVAFQEALERDPPRSVIALVGTTDTTRYPASFIEPGLARAGFRQESVREFPRLEISVRLYGRPETVSLPRAEGQYQDRVLAMPKGGSRHFPR